MPHIGPVMSKRDVRLVAALDDATGSEWSEPLARGFCGPFVCCGPTRPATTVAYASPPSVDPSCGLLSAASSPVGALGRGPLAEHLPGRRAMAGRLKRTV